MYRTRVTKARTLHSCPCFFACTSRKRQRGNSVAMVCRTRSSSRRSHNQTGRRGLAKGTAALLASCDAWPTILHPKLHMRDAVDDVIAFLETLKQSHRVQAVYLQGFRSLERPEVFPHLLNLLRTNHTLWSLNLGEVVFSQTQLESVLKAICRSSVTHGYMDDTLLSREEKRRLLAAFRRNRSKHTQWVLRTDGSNLDIILGITHCFFNPRNHDRNKKYR